MSQTITQLKRGGSTTIDITTAGSTDYIVLTTAYSTFSLQFIFTGADADPLFILEGSNDNVTWSNIYVTITDAERGVNTPSKFLMTKASSDSTDGIDAFSGNNIPFKSFRVRIEPNGATTGNCTGIIITEIEQG